MRIGVVSAFRAGSLKAHAVNVVKMAEGFLNLGHEVMLITGDLDKGIRENNLDSIYGLDEKLLWKRQPFYVGQNLLFALLSWNHIKSFLPDLVYTRNFACPWLYTLKGVAVAGESHAHPENNSFWFKQFIRTTWNDNFKVWITINEVLMQGYKRLGAADKFIILADAVDTKLFKRPDTLQDSPYPHDKKIVTYCGHLYDYKGIPTILKAAVKLPEVEFHFVGGLPEDLHRQRVRAIDLKLKNVVFNGIKPHTEVAPYLWHSDILLLPPSANHPTAKWTSPVKAGEYLISGVPVIATSIPALKRWFTNKEVEFIKPDNPDDMVSAIKKLLADKQHRKSLIKAGNDWAENHTYTKRAHQIIEASLQ